MYTCWLVEILLHLCPFEFPSSSDSSFLHPAVRANRSAQLQSPLAGCMMHSNRVPVAVTVAVSSWQNRTCTILQSLVWCPAYTQNWPRVGQRFFCLAGQFFLFGLILTHFHWRCNILINTLKEQPLNTSSETELLSKPWLSHGLAAIHHCSQLQSIYSCDGSLGGCPPQLLQEEYVRTQPTVRIKLESPHWVAVHQAGFMMFKPMVQEQSKGHWGLEISMWENQAKQTNKPQILKPFLGSRMVLW
jgi:hypothetical protein